MTPTTEEQEQLTPAQIHDVLLTSMVRALGTTDQELIAFARGRYQQFWSEHLIVPKPPKAEDEKVSDVPDPTNKVEPPNGKPQLKTKVPAKTR